ncbi:AAA family ATPase [Arhodomonas aquaeolei]|uniref:ExeA family protein n=1 Tax=Arhodomonas aquaeolei TaxID=2369 RepID=UPI002169D4A5|nr:ExeA family protein [Arhodomonas aquaeolei]MCS4503405.1 AAA family ATPase [Arhodomonas aquaeolei]
MYEAAYGLHGRAFALPPDPGFLFLGRAHREALAHLVYGVRERTGFVLLTGEVGTGKTLLARALLERLPGDVDTAWLYRPAESTEGFVAAVLRELGETPEPDADATALVAQLNRRLLDAHARGRTTVLLVDEAQTLPAAVLEQLRLLTNLETRHEKLLQILLVGQPELAATLARTDMRQVAQRITARYHLRPFERGETRAYVRHRLSAAGGDPGLFTEGAVRALHEASGGIPRLINVIADRALLGGYARGRRRIGRGLVRQAALELGHEHDSAWQWPAVAIATVLASVAVVWPFLAHDREHAPPRLEDPAKVVATAAYTRADDAVNALLARMGIAADRGDGGGPAGCARARLAGYACLHFAADWPALARLRRPALLELHEDGRAGSVLAEGVTSAGATLRRGNTTHPASRTALLPLWTGDALVVWRPPGLTPLPAGPGDDGESVRWLRGRLHTPAPPDLATRFDPALAAQLRDYQHQLGLPVTGRLDAVTLFYLRETESGEG